MPAAVLIQGGEFLREEPGHQLEDLSGDMVHPRPRPVPDLVVLDRALLEPLEGLEHRGAVVGLILVAADVDPPAPDAGAVADPPEVLLTVACIAGQRSEPGRGRIRSQVVPEGQQGAGADRRRGEVPGQRLHRVAVDGRRVQQPALPLVAVPHLRQLTQVGAYLADSAGEALDRIEQGRVLQVLENLLAVAHGAGIAQTGVEDPGDEVTFLAITRDHRHDLVQVQIPRERAILVLLSCTPRRRAILGQQAGVVTGFSR